MSSSALFAFAFWSFLQWISLCFLGIVQLNRNHLVSTFISLFIPSMKICTLPYANSLEYKGNGAELTCFILFSFINVSDIFHSVNSVMTSTAINFTPMHNFTWLWIEINTSLLCLWFSQTEVVSHKTVHLRSQMRMTHHCLSPLSTLPALLDIFFLFFFQAFILQNSPTINPSN